ncbi:MAG: hypothetical protein GHCLOJNM_02745 [bacterium]|nr:hypothetical protein [bacterium]
MVIETKPIRYYEARAEVAKALSHPSRLMILEALSERERCVCELTELVGADQSTVSKHLAIMRNVGLLETRKEGAQVYYRPRIKCLNGFFQCVEMVLRERWEADKVWVGDRE